MCHCEYVICIKRVRYASSSTDETTMVKTVRRCVRVFTMQLCSNGAYARIIIIVVIGRLMYVGDSQ